MRISKNNVLLFIVLLAGIFLELWNIGNSPVEEWDEARRGINAIGMINHNDCLTYYFLDETDDFVNKPPLATWLISLNFRLFGYNVIALRLHSIIAVIFFFFYTIKLVRLYKDWRFTLMVLSILVTINGIIGFHVGRTGDTDSLLLLFTTAALYHFLKYWDFGDNKSIYLSMLFAGLAFYSKGLAFLLILPGVAGIMAFSMQKSKILNRHVAFSMLIFLAIVASWYILAVTAPARNDPGPASATNLWQGLWQVDGITRFFSRGFEGGYNPWFLLHVFDSNFNIWSYILYGGLIFLLIQWAWKRNLNQFKGDRLLAVSAFLAGGLAIILMLSYNKHRWYFAPGYLFLSVITATFIEFLVKKKQWVSYLFIALACFLFIRRVIEFSDNDTHIRDFFQAHELSISPADELWITTEVGQDYILPFIFLNPDNLKRVDERDTLPGDKNVMIFTSKDFSGSVIGTLDGYKLLNQGKTNFHD